MWSSEAELAPAVPRGEAIVAASSFDQLYLDQYVPMVRLAVRLVDRRERAEEIVQDCFERLLLRWDRLEQPAAYLRAAVVNGCRGELRRREVSRRFERHQRPVLGADDAPDELTDALRRLRPRQRVAIVLRYYADLPEREIAEVLGCRPGTVKSLLSRGLAELRTAVER